MAARIPVTPLSLAFTLAGAALVPDEAEACRPPLCDGDYGLEAVDPVNADAIPIDGVLALKTAGTVDLASIQWTVTRDGQPVDGALEKPEVPDILLWRPAQPLTPGPHQVTGMVVNSDEDPDDCVPDMLALDFEFLVEAEPSAPLAAPTIDVQETVSVKEVVALDGLVCCDGAMPSDNGLDCGPADPSIFWSEGHCQPTRGAGTLRAKFSVTTGLPAATDALVTRQLVVDGAPYDQPRLGVSPLFVSTQPFCTEVVLRNLATGETLTTPQQCHGADVADQLGDQPIDPGPGLAAVCSGAAYTCAILDDVVPRWDPAQCTEWPPTDDPTGGTTGDPGDTGDTTGAPDDSTGDPGGDTGGDTGGGQDGAGDKGCGCDTDDSPPGALLALAGIGLVLHRRRRP